MIVDGACIVLMQTGVQVVGTNDCGWWVEEMARGWVNVLDDLDFKQVHVTPQPRRLLATLRKKEETVRLVLEPAGG